ncbi:MAG: putative prolin-rich exported protein [Candidatus Sulfotelmatobacter sp.]|nr:putative prolin-rich exported protein [Candidatus Sulfotelmatobacter sp.]
MKNTKKQLGWWSALLALTLAIVILPLHAAAQDYQQQDDPPSRVARLGYLEGSVSFQPAGENDWVGAVENRPMTTGDKLWADKGSRAELQLGSAVIRLSENTGVSFLNLDDRTVQLQLSSGSVNVRVRRLDRDDDIEIDTPNLAFTIQQPGSYRLEASEDGGYSVVTIREGEGQATGNGQTYTLHNGQRGTFNGSESLNADVEQLGEPDQFDNWANNRDHRYESSRSAQYVSNDMVGYDDLDDNGDWRDDSNYGHVWYPHVEAGWAPYHQGHWDWIDPWGYTWVDDSNWGYAPFHYGRWASVGGRWGWIAGPREERAVYAPALVVFVGGGGGGFGGNVGWFPLGPREVYAPSYPVSREYMNRVNISNTTVNTTTINNVYTTTVINRNTTNVTNVTYVNRNVQGAVTAVPQRAFASAQPVARSAVQMNARDIASVPVTHRVAVNPTREAVLGARAGTANRVTAPPPAVMNRQVIARKAPPPPPAPFAERQQAMAAHPGQPLPRREVATLRPAPAAAAHPMVRVAPPGKPATPTTGHPNNQPANNAGRPGQPAPGAPANQPGNRPGNQPAPNERPGAANQPNQPNNRPGQPNQPEANRPGQPNNRPEANQPNNRPGQPNQPQPNQPNNRPGQPNQPEANRPGQPNNQPQPNQPNNRPEANRPPAAEPNRPQPNQPNNRPEPNRPPAAEPNRPQPNQPNNRPEANRPTAAEPNRPQPNQPNNRPEANRPPAAEPNRPQPNQPNNRPEPNRPAAEPSRPQPSQPSRSPEANRPESRPPAAQPNNRPEPNRQPAAQPQNHPQERTPPPAAQRPAPPPQREQPRPQTPEEKKKQEQQKPPGI